MEQRWAQLLAWLKNVEYWLHRTLALLLLQLPGLLLAALLKAGPSLSP